jgi:amino acid permease-like protein
LRFDHSAVMSACQRSRARAPIPHAAVARPPIAGCVYLAGTLPAAIWMRFVVWMVLGLVVYMF